MHVIMYKSDVKDIRIMTWYIHTNLFRSYEYQFNMKYPSSFTTYVPSNTNMNSA